MLESHLPTDHVGIAELLRDAPGCHACCDPPRFQHDDLALDPIEQRGRNAGGLAGPRRRLEHGGGVRPQRFQQFRQGGIDGQGFLHGGRHDYELAEVYRRMETIQIPRATAAKRRVPATAATAVRRFSLPSRASDG